MLKIQPVMAQKTSFQGKGESKLDRLQKLADQADRFNNEDLTDAERADMLKEMSEEEGMPKFLKFFLSALGVGGAGFLGGKIATGKLVKLADNKKYFGVMDTIGNKVSNAVKDFTGAKPTDKGLKAMFADGAHKFAKWFNDFGKKGLDPDVEINASVIAKNGIKKLTSTAGGLTGAGLAVRDASQDKDGDDVPKILDPDDNAESGGVVNKAQKIGNTVSDILDMAS